MWGATSCGEGDEGVRNHRWGSVRRSGLARDDQADL